MPNRNKKCDGVNPITAPMTVAFAIVFFAAAVLGRFLPHAPNFVPIAALALWSGFYLPKRIGFALPVAAMFISDAVIGFYDPRLMAVVYGSFVLTVAIGWFVRRERSVTAVALGSVAGSVLFFLATNFAVWALSNWYPHTANGLLGVYLAGIPFFRSTLFSDLAFNALFFGAYALALALARRRQPAPTTTMPIPPEYSGTSARPYDGR